MKRKLLVLTAFALCLALLCGCTTIATSEWMQNLFPVGDEAVAAQQTGSVEDSTAEQEVKQVVTETYTELDAFGLAYQPDYGLQPYNCQSLNNRIIFSFLYEPLFAVTSSYEAESVLAETYFVTDDGRTTTVKLRSGVTFHDGSRRGLFHRLSHGLRVLRLPPAVHHRGAGAGRSDAGARDERGV